MSSPIRPLASTRQSLTAILRSLNDERFGRRVLLLLCAAGFILRLAWLLSVPGERLVPHRSEMWNVAQTFARTGSLADAYGPGSGISAHVGPFNTILAGYIYRIFGVGDVRAELILSVFAIAWVLGTVVALYLAFRELGVPVSARLAAAALITLLPLQFYLETVDFRIREGALAAFLGSAALLALIRLEKRGLSWSACIGIALLCAFTFLVSPVIALGAYGGLGILLLRKMPPVRWPAAGAIVVAALLLVNLPWIVRNELVYGKFMLSRGNAGLELAIANHPGAVNPADPHAAFFRRLREVHPFFTKQAYLRLKASPSDVAYADRLGDEAKQWIADHPREASTIWLRHLREFYFPPKWQWNLYYSGYPGLMPVRQALSWATAFLAIFGLAAGLFRNFGSYVYVASAALLPTIPYMIFQPTLRYRYQLTALITFLAVAEFWWLFAKLARRQPSSTSRG